MTSFETKLRAAAAQLATARSVAVLTGAGVSAESGIPTFRGLGGLWQGRDPASLATPEAFKHDPVLVWKFYNWRRDLVSQATPNAAHRALAGLELTTHPFTLITQNVDRLHQRAGSKNVLEVHGNLFDTRCTGCEITLDRTGTTLPPLPRCEECGALLRPAVVWFGEALPSDVWRRAEQAVETADVLLVVGTSAVVFPAAGLVSTSQHAGHFVVEVNLEPTSLSRSVDVALCGPAGEILPALVSEVERLRLL
jgi:NAD-dependent deacetylase